MTATILIADASPAVRAATRRDLEASGYLVHEADDGVMALAQCRQAPPDVALLDSDLPALDGHQVLAALKEDAHLQDIPVVLLSEHTGMDDVRAGLRGGAQDYLRKPFEAGELLARVRSAIQVKQLQDALRQRDVDVDHLTRTDPLTGLYNSQHLEVELHRMHREVARFSDDLSVILFDVDHLARINDSLGRYAGDQVLTHVARTIRRELRQVDISGRWGAEEFLILLPRTNVRGARRAAQRICDAIAAAPIAVGDQDLGVTVSGGCAELRALGRAGLIRQAEHQLQEAKNAGRNCIRPATDRVATA